MNNQLLAVLSVRPFLFLWLSELFSQIAANMVNFILIVLAYDLSSSNAAVSGIVLSFTVPSILFGVLAGVIVDRSDKKKVLFYTNILRAILLVLLAFFHANLGVIYILSLLISMVTQFFIPAESPMIPLVVQKKLLLPANALFGMGIYGSVFLGYTLSGAFLILFGSSSVFLILALFFGAAAFFAHLVRPKEAEPFLPKGSFSFRSVFKYEITSAFSVIRKSRVIYQSMLLIAFSQTLVFILAAIGPGFSKQVLQIPVNQFSFYFVTPSAIGMVIGAILIGTFFHDRSKNVLTTIGIFSSAFLIFILPFLAQFSINSLFLIICIAFVLGIANAFVFVPSNTVLQEEIANAMRGKVYGVLSTMIGIFSLIPILLAGGLADVIGVSGVLMGISCAIFIIGIMRFFHK